MDNWLIKNKIPVFLRLPWREKIWLLLLFPFSGIVRLILLTTRFSWLAPWLGQHYQNYQLSPLVSQKKLWRAWRIGRIVDTVGRYTPWQSKCLVQAILARTLLGFYGIPYVIHLGACLKKDPAEPMKAHAWIKVGPWIVVGREGHRNFTVVSSFVSPSILENKPKSQYFLVGSQQ